MAELEKGKTVSLQELMVSTLAMTDALPKLLIEKGVITHAEFKQKAAGGTCGVSADSESYGTVTAEPHSLEATRTESTSFFTT